MTAWDTCSVCGKPSTSGMVVCYACAAKIVEDKRRAGIPIRRVYIDGERHEVGVDNVSVRELPSIGEYCPACRLPVKRDSLGNILCKSCGYRNSET